MKNTQDGMDRRTFLRGGLVLGGGALIGPGILAGSGHAAPDVTTAVTLAGAPKRGGHLRIGTIHDPVSFDAFQGITSNSSINRNCYAYPVGYAAGFDPVPHVADWEIADDHRSVVVKLRDGLTFHTGKAVVADDIVATLERGRNEEAALNFFGQMALVDSWEKVDELSVRITFVDSVADTAITDFLNYLPIVDATKNDLETLKSTEAGCGAFRVLDHQPGVSLELERFDGFWDPALPYLDGITFSVFDSPATIVTALQAGDVDAMVYASAQDVKALGDDFTVFDLTQGLDAVVVLLNPTRPPFDDKALRHAIQRSIDRERIHSDVFLGYGDPIVVPYAPNSAVHDESLLEEYGFDLDAAAEFLRESGAEMRAEVLLNGANNDFVRIAEILKSDLAEIGFELEIQPLERQAFSEPYFAGDYSMVIGGIGPHRANPAAKEASIVLRSSENTLWGDAIPPDYVEAMHNAATAVTPEEAQQAAEAIRAIHLDEAWAIAIQTKPELHVARNGVNGMVASSGSGTLDQRETWLA